MAGLFKSKKKVTSPKGDARTDIDRPPFAKVSEGQVQTNADITAVEKKTEKKPVVAKEAKPKKQPPTDKQPSRSDNDFNAVLISPRITEKATDIQMDHNAYTFNVLSSVTKQEVMQAVESVYGVKPVKVRMIKIPSKRVTTRKGKRGLKSGGKKAYVSLKKGDSIEFV